MLKTQSATDPSHWTCTRISETASHLRFFIAISLISILVLGTFRDCTAQQPAQTADRILLGGPIITMNAEAPAAEAVAIAGQRLLAVGSRQEVLKHRGPNTVVTDLSGKAVLPGFIDAHGHVTGVAQSLAQVELAPPPVGTVKDIGDLQAALRLALEQRKLAPGEWLSGRGYDDSMLAEKRHPLREDLDAVSTEIPIALTHVSGHLVACNSAALAASNITASRKDPSGGHIRRKPGGTEPSGVLEESAAGLLQRNRRPTTVDEQLDLLDRAQKIYASYGVTTAQDGASNASRIELLQTAARQKRLLVDVVAYVSPASLEDLPYSLTPGRYMDGLKLGGVKLFLDGSPQGKTAYLSRPYHVPPPGQPADYRGYPAMSDKRVDELLQRFLSQGIQVIAHANGDAAAEQLIGAVERALPSIGMRDHRTVMIHAQTVRLDQLPRMHAAKMIPSFFVAHTFYWGDWHRDSVLGPDRAAHISPAHGALDLDLKFTFHNDAPVVPPHMPRLIWAGVNRLSRSGEVIGPDERIDTLTALQAVTINAAYQHFDEAEKGSLVAGKLADIVILDANPLTVDPVKLNELRIVETIRHGKTIYEANYN